MCAMNMGLHIVTPDWVKDSVKSGNLQEESDYQVDDSESEAKWGFSVSDSLTLARKSTIVGNKNRHQGTLLQGYEVFITKNTGPSKPVLKDIIETAGGKVSLTLQRSYQLEKHQTYIAVPIIAACYTSAKKAARCKLTE
jgi:hypothetical protein